jgi:hypothetical protein
MSHRGLFLGGDGTSIRGLSRDQPPCGATLCGRLVRAPVRRNTQPLGSCLVIGGQVWRVAGPGLPVTGRRAATDRATDRTATDRTAVGRAVGRAATVAECGRWPLAVCSGLPAW